MSAENVATSASTDTKSLGRRGKSQYVFTLMEVLPSVLKQLEDIQRRLEPLEKGYFERKHRAECEAAYRHVEARLGDK